MKKWIAFLLVFMLAFVFVGCRDGEETPDKDAPESITINATKTEIDINEELELTASVAPDTASQDVQWSSRNQAVAIVDPITGKVTGKAPGEAEIVASARSDSKIQGKVVIKVKQPAVVYDPPTSITISSRRAEVEKGRKITLTARVLPETASQEVLWESSDNTVATVDGNGLVTGVTLGPVTIIAKVLANTDLFYEFQIEVVPYNNDLTIVEPDSISIEGEAKVYEGTFIYLVSTVYPSGASQNVFWSSDNPDIATVDQEGKVVGLKEGIAWIRVTTTRDTSVYELFRVEVKVNPIDTDIPDLGGYKIEILVNDSEIGRHDPTKAEYAGLDKAAKSRAWLEIEDSFNCDFVEEAYPATAPWGPQRIQWLIDNALINQSQGDIFVSSTDWTKALADGNAIVDTTQFYDWYGLSSMSPFVKVASSYNGGLYSIPTANAGSINVDKGLFYNMALIERYNLESPAKLFNEGRWTYSGFDAYVRNADSLLGPDQTVLSGIPALYYMGMVNAGGIKLADTSNLTINFDNQYAIQAAHILTELNEDIGWGTVEWDEKVTSFNDGNSIFCSGDFWFVDASNRYSSDMWGNDTRYGYVPYPYPDQMQKDEARTVYSGGSVYMMTKGRAYGPNVTAEKVYRAFVTMMMKTNEYILADAEFDEETIMRRSAQKKLDDPESVTAITFFKRNRVVFDPIFGMQPAFQVIGPQMNRVIINSEDYTQITDSLKPTYETKLDDLYG